MSALEAIGSMALAATQDRAPLVVVEREARCEGCGRRVAANTEGRRVAGAVVHVECLHIFAGPGGR